MTRARLLALVFPLLLLTGCYPGAYPIDIFIEMHYQQSQRRLEPNRLSVNPEAVPVTGSYARITFDQSAQLQNPIQRNPADQGRMDLLFRANCGMCHGQNGDGQSVVAQRFQQVGFVPPVDFKGPRATGRTDGQLYWIITNGLGNMPTFADLLSDDERWLLVHKIRQIQGR